MNPAYLEDASGFRGYADAVHCPASEVELCELLAAASDQGIPITVAGSGTGVTGGRVPLGGWVISLERLNRLEIAPGIASAGAGVVLRDLHAAASRSGQFYAPDPTEDRASIGGTIATNASGSRSFRYGPTRNHILELRVAFLNGTVREFFRGEPVDFHARAVARPASTKHSAGISLWPRMDWIDLFAGSEGTLGIVTAAKLKLLPAPRDLLTGVIFFTSDDSALDAVERWRWRIRLRMLEYIDAASLDLLRPAYPDIPRPARAALMIEEEVADDATINEWADSVSGATPLADAAWFAAGSHDRERFRRFRHALPEAVNSAVRSRGLLKMGTDFAVPIDRNREMLAFYRERLDAAFPGRHVIFGHIGDAHLHVNILPQSGDEEARAAGLILEFARRAVAWGGTVAAEHGLGKRKAHLLELQYGADDIEAMRAVKLRFDPQWLLGRGTLFPVPAP